MTETYCCDMMKQQIETPECQHHSRSDCPDTLIIKIPSIWSLGDRKMWAPKFVLPIKDGGSSFVEIFYCPWCGKKLEG